MEVIIFSVYDVKAETYLPPFHAPTNAVAMRSFEEAANDPQHQFNKHPEDYILFRTGRFDQDDGVLASEVPVPLTKAIDLIAPGEDVSVSHIG